MTVTFTCPDCGKLSDGRSGIDDAMDCFCPRCTECGEITYAADGLCDDCVDDEDDWFWTCEACFAHVPYGGACGRCIAEAEMYGR